MNIYVGNLSYEIKEEELKEEFMEFGAVESCKIIMDRFTGRSKGYGFVEMLENSEAEAAVNALNGKSVKGRDIRVNESKPNPARSNTNNKSYNQRRY
ncbi:MAG: RNA-binding protein [Deltaproteobacteria bacterium]|nr:RNA-binding protein [Deltaproteobacteria bacterium]